MADNETAHDAAGNKVTGTMDGMIFLSGDVIACPDATGSVSEDGTLSLANGHAAVSSDGVLEIIQ